MLLLITGRPNINSVNCLLRKRFSPAQRVFIVDHLISLWTALLMTPERSNISLSSLSALYSSKFYKMSAFTFMCFIDVSVCVSGVTVCVCVCVCVCPCVAMRRSLLYLFSQNITLSHYKPLPVQVTAKNPPQCCELGTGLLDT